jgi:hypothetical protein
MQMGATRAADALGWPTAPAHLGSSAAGAPQNAAAASSAAAAAPTRWDSVDSGTRRLGAAARGSSSLGSGGGGDGGGGGGGGGGGDGGGLRGGASLLGGQGGHGSPSRSSPSRSPLSPFAHAGWSTPAPPPGLTPAQLALSRVVDSGGGATDRRSSASAASGGVGGVVGGGSKVLRCKLSASRATDVCELLIKSAQRAKTRVADGEDVRPSAAAAGGGEAASAAVDEPLDLPMALRSGQVRRATLRSDQGQ